MISPSPVTVFGPIARLHGIDERPGLNSTNHPGNFCFFRALEPCLAPDHLNIRIGF
jgi:hypothetical protein